MKYRCQMISNMSLDQIHPDREQNDCWGDGKKLFHGHRVSVLQGEKSSRGGWW